MVIIAEESGILIAFLPVLQSQLSPPQQYVFPKHPITILPPSRFAEEIVRV